MALKLPPSGFTDATAPIKGVRYAGWLRRAGGFLIDGLLLLTIQYLLGTIFSFAPNIFISGLYAHPGLATAFYYVVMLGGVGAAYATLCLDRLHGQTPGMAAVRIRCETTRRGSLTLARCLVRSVTQSILVYGLLWFAYSGSPYRLLGDLGIAACFLWPVVDSRRQTPWDHVARTVVLDEHY